MNEPIENVCEYRDADVSDNDLIEIQTSSVNFKNSWCKNKKLHDNSDVNNKRINSKETQIDGNNASKDNGTVKPDNESDTVLDITHNFAGDTADCEQGIVEECLLDLDNYLEQMEGACLQENGNDNSIINRSYIEDIPKKYIEDIPKDTRTLPLQREKSSAKSDIFSRDSNFRKTFSCRLQNRDPDGALNQCNTPPNCRPLYATWNKQALRNSNINEELDKIKNKTEDTNCNCNGEIEHPENNNNSSNGPESCASDNILRRLSQNNCSDEVPSNSLQILTDEQIFQNLIGQNQTVQNETTNNGPRQFGRRAERCLRQSTSVNNADQIALSGVCSQNPMYISSEGSTSCNTSSISIHSILDSGESNNTSGLNFTMNDEIVQQSPLSTDQENSNESMDLGFNSYWPHHCSRTLALISCTLGLFNISRFAILTINYGGNFLISFLILSVIFGIPFLWLQMCLGEKIKADPISMWKISPICSGIGISLILVQYFITIYSSVAIVWLLVYIGDIFRYHSSYPWAEFSPTIIANNISHFHSSKNLTESVPFYFNLNVLQRLQIFKTGDGNDIRFHICDHLAFYVAMLWAVVFLILCKGLKSFGKTLLVLGLLPLVFLAVFTGKLLFVVDLSKLKNVFSSSEFDDFFVNSKIWSAAAQETFLTWGLLGTSIIAISSHTHGSSSKLTLRSDAILVVLVTLIGLSLSAIVGLCSVKIVNQLGYVYVPGSYETPEHYSSIYSLHSSPSSDLISYPTKYIPHYSTLIGEVYRRDADIKNVSGYQVLRFVTELLPATVAITTENISWTWTLVIFITLFAFGITQLCVMWKPVSCALGNSTSAVLLSCVTGLLLSIPFVTEIGITLLHYIDMLLGGAWFIPILWAAEIFAVFLIRGRPYNGDELVNDLRMSGTMSAFLALSWNVLLPIGLITLAVIEYKTSLSSQLYYWRGTSYFSYWSRKLGALTQIGFLLLIPVSAIIQIYRYLTSGPPDILDRIQMLYRPLDEPNTTNTNSINSRYQDSNVNRSDYGVRQLQSESPPKYTPPPSYTTATGARLARFLRQSIRRSVRRFLGDSERPRPTLPMEPETRNELNSYSPEYTSVLTSRSDVPDETNRNTTETNNIENRHHYNTLYGRSLSLGRKQLLHKRCSKKANDRSISAYRAFNFSTFSNRRLPRTTIQRPYTAEDVITILRSSNRSQRRAPLSLHTQNKSVFRSTENLVLNAEPPDSGLTVTHNDSGQNDDNSTSVI